MNPCQHWDHCDCDDHVAECEKQMTPLTNAAPDAALLEAQRQIHAAHDVGHKAGAWPNACMGCQMYVLTAQAADTIKSEIEKPWREGVQSAANELGVPTPDYAAPVANAANILRALLTEDAKN